MPTITLGVQTGDTSNTTSYTSGSFTPAAGDRLYAIVHARATVVSGGGTMTDSQGLGFSQVTTAQISATNTVSVFRSDNLAAASSMTVTYDCTGDAATGAIINVFRCAGGGRTVQFKINNGTGAGTPSVTMDAAIKTTNSCIGVASDTGESPSTFTPPASWTELAETGISAPTFGAEMASRNSGETNTTINWGESSVGSWIAVVVEIAAEFSITASAGSYSETGTAATLKAGRKLSADSGSYSESGTEATLKAGRKIAANSGVFIITGTAADLIYVPVSGYTLTADSGSYSLTGVAAALRAARKIAADSGIYNVTGIDAALKAVRKLAADSGTYSVTGQDANLKALRKIAANTGSYIITGTDASFKRTYVMAAGNGTYIWTGTAANLIAPVRPPADGWWVFKSPKRNARIEMNA